MLSARWRLTSFRIKNPLIGISKSDLFQDVENYAAEHQLQDLVPLLRKGALVAQNPQGFEDIEELTEDERIALRDEIAHRWKQSKTLYFLITLSSIGACIQGWDQTGSNGAILSFPQAFDIADTGSGCNAAGTYEKNSWIVGVINAAPYISIALLYVFLVP